MGLSFDDDNRARKMDDEFANKIKKEKPELYQQLIDGTIGADGARKLAKYILDNKEDNNNGK